MYRSTFGQKFFIPAEHDVLISYAPIRNKADNYVGLSVMGKIRLRTWYQESLTEGDQLDPYATTVPRAIPRPPPDTTTPLDPTT